MSESPPPQKRPSFFRQLVRLALLVLLLAVGCNLWVLLTTSSRIFDDAEKINVMPVGLVLGTTRKVSKDELNQHFENRVAAAASLYLAGKVERLLVSGFREESGYYDEPRDMTARLLELGVPAAAITPDHAGLRTLDSVVRARRVYGLERITVISDDFHVPRALFIADREGIEAIGFRGDSVSLSHSIRARVREFFARVKAVIDLYLLDTQPGELGLR
jgi:SanA protein